MTGTEPAAAPPPEPEVLRLASEFDAVEREQWLRAVDGVLRKAGRLADDAPTGAGLDVLTRTRPDGVRVLPLYTAADVEGVDDAGAPGAWPFTRGSRAEGRPDGWDVRQRHTGTDAAAVREAVLADLDGGVTSVWLAAGEGGVPVADLPAALDGVLLDLAAVALDAGAEAQQAVDALLDLADARGTAPGDLLASLGLDPVGLRARTGTGPDVASVVPLARRVAESYPHVAAVTVDASAVREAGGSDAQQLGFSLASGVAYLRALVDDGLDVAAAARVLEFRYAVTAEQFPTIALLRAARRLWARVLEACGTTEVAQRQHAVVSDTTFTRRDPYVNVLRGTVAAFAAGVGGADAVTVPPFDVEVGAPQAFSRRLARNTQLLLVEESHVARVMDPGGGSWYVERLTDDLARAGWEAFQRIEAGGGVLAVLDDGSLAREVEEVRAGRERRAARRTAPVTGVSEFADLDEKPLVRDPLPGRAEPAGLPRYRPAGAFEAFRDRSDEALARDGRRPTAFLATLGPLATYSARASFCRNLFAGGGVATPEAGPTDDVEAVVAAFREASTPVAVLCSGDALYDERAEATAAALHEAGARVVLLAGRPAEPVPGVDGLVHAGCDALAAIDLVHRATEEAKA
ncbi:methylmalonyl-CoA mutase family protein [Angustibacter speluncae]